jgi:hypothetical protein
VFRARIQSKIGFKESKEKLKLPLRYDEKYMEVD